MPVYPINFPELSLPALFLICMAGMMILSGRDARWIVLALAIQYVGVFLLVFIAWPEELAATKLIAGWMSAALLGVGLRNASFRQDHEEHFSPASRIFRILITGFVLLTMYTMGVYAQDAFPEVGMEIILGSLFLMGTGILHLGLHTQPFRVIVGLLTFLSGFEVLYAALENAVLVAGMLALLNLSLGFLGVYLIAEADQEVIM